MLLYKRVCPSVGPSVVPNSGSVTAITGFLTVILTDNAQSHILLFSGQTKCAAAIMAFALVLMIAGLVLLILGVTYLDNQVSNSLTNQPYFSWEEKKIIYATHDLLCPSLRD